MWCGMCRWVSSRPTPVICMHRRYCILAWQVTNGGSQCRQCMLGMHRMLGDAPLLGRNVPDCIRGGGVLVLSMAGHVRTHGQCVNGRVTSIIRPMFCMV